MKQFIIYMYFYFIDIRPKKKYRNLNFQYKRKIIPEVQNVIQFFINCHKYNRI